MRGRIERGGGGGGVAQNTEHHPIRMRRKRIFRSSACADSFFAMELLTAIVEKALLGSQQAGGALGVRHGTREAEGFREASITADGTKLGTPPEVRKRELTSKS